MSSAGTPAAGDLELFVARHGAYVTRLAAHFLRDPHEAEDLAQDVFILVARDLRKVREPELIRRWLARLVRNRAMTHLGRNRRRSALLTHDVDNEDLADPAPGIEERMQAAAGARALRQLPERQRLPWTLHVMEGETLAAVAQTCDCSLATVKRRIATARLTLCRALAA